jgi:outer membrane protein TolC
MISLADTTRIIATARRRTCRALSACIVLFAGSALFGQQAQFQGNVPTGVASATPVALTLHDAIDRGLRANLGLLLSGQASESARGERLRSLSALLPQVTGAVSENV